MRCLRYATFLYSVTLASLACAQSPLHYIQHVIAERNKLQSMEVQVSVDRGVFRSTVPDAEVLANSKFKYHFFVSKPVTRVDCFETRPKDPLNAAFLKFSLVSGTVRAIPGRGDVFFVEQPRSAERSQELEWFESSLFAINPALIGFWPDHFELLKLFKPEKIIGLCTGDGIVTTLTEDSQCKIFEGSWHGSRMLRWEYRFHKEFNVPISVMLDGVSGPGMTDRLTSAWRQMKGIPVPIACAFEQRDKGTVTRAENWTLEWHSLNSPISPEVGSWVSLGIKNHDVVKFIGDESTIYREWVDGEWRTWKPAPLMLKTDSMRRTVEGSWSRLLIVANLVVLGVLLIFLGARRLIRRAS